MKTKLFLVIIGLISTQLSFSQIIDVDYSKKGQNFIENEDEKPVEILGRSFVDFFNNGKMQGTAQLMKINIGEKDKFYIPFYLFLGASGDGLGTPELNENTVANLLNPIGGIFNGTFNGRNNLYKSESGITSLKIAYQLSGKLINAQDSLTGVSSFLGSGYGNVGLFFQTGAWEDGDSENMGVFWIQAKITSSFGFQQEQLENIFGNETKDNYFIGYSFDLGLEINNRVNLKIGAYQYKNNQNIELLNKPVFKFSLDYNLKK